MVKTPEVVTSSLYAVIDLGSNSFHMLITRQLGDSVQVVEKIKRQVRLASGLDAQQLLSSVIMESGWQCLRFFAERLHDIPAENIRIVATATLRLAKNRDEFLVGGEKILSHKITLLSGIEEAKNIYLGVAHTSKGSDERLVFDIGGASTEIVLGHGFEVQKACSLNMGCVTFNQQFFPDQILSNSHVNHAIAAAKQLIKPVVEEYQQITYQDVFGGSGSMQALAEILIYQQQLPIITLPFLHKIKQQLLNFKNFTDIDIAGLAKERIPVFVSGVVILIALFEQFSITALKLSQGALREGLLYDMLPKSKAADIRQQTVNDLAMRFHVDKKHSSNVAKQALSLYQQVANSWHLDEDSNRELLLLSCQLHEIGLAIGYKNYQQHSAYIINHADLIGFNDIERKLLVMLVSCFQGAIKKSLVEECCRFYANGLKLLIILRIAVVLSARSNQENFVECEWSIVNATTPIETIKIRLPSTWRKKNTLIINNLIKEAEYLTKFNITLELI